METSGTAPRVAQTASDVPELAAAFDAAPPFVTIYLDTTADVEKAADKTAVRWANLRRDLEQAGAPGGALEGIDELVNGMPHLEGQTLAVVANAGGVLYAANEPEPPKRDFGWVAPLPRIGALLEWRQQGPPHVVVRIDRKGADIVGFAYGRPDVERQVEGDADDDTLRKSAPGGWSQRRYQQRAENAWSDTAGDVATAVEKIAKRIDARLILVAGDVRVVAMLKDALAADWQSKVVELDGGRGQDGSDDAIADEAVRAVATAVAEDTVALLQKFREELGQNDRASDGVARTVEALQRARVDVLLVHDDPDDDRTVWFGPDPVHVATNPDDLRAMGVEDPQQGRLVDVLLRSAMGTGAGVRIIPSAGGPTDAVGAILRF